MNLIPNITNDPLQNLTLILADGSTVKMTIYFVPMQYGWFITEITYGDFTLHGLRITNSINMLNQWRNIIPFGLGCVSTANVEPSQQQDFSSGNSNLYLLSKAETEEYAEYLRIG